MVALTINTNLASLNSQRVLELSRSQLGRSITRLATGVKISGASDGVAELALSESIRSDVRALQQGSRNLNDGLALIRTAEAALNDISSTFIRLRELASQAANGTVGDTERQTINLEYQSLLAELDRISNSTSFRDTILLDGTLAKSASEHLVLQVGVDSTSDNQIDLNNELDLTQVSRAAFNLEDSNVTSQGAAFLALNDLTSSIDTLIEIRSRAGSTQIRLTSALNNLNSCNKRAGSMKASGTSIPFRLAFRRALLSAPMSN